MNHRHGRFGIVIALLVSAMLASGAVYAAKDSNDKKSQRSEKHQGDSRRDHDDSKARRTRDKEDRGHRAREHGSEDDAHDHHSGDRKYFSEDHREQVRHYFAEEFRQGRCPPGLAKKRNGCRPPGLAKQWSRDRPLSNDVVYYELPPRVVISLGPPPPGSKYVRVANDILLIAIGSKMVIDAITDLSDMQQ
jgi:Ni/Co efflux regulator RcnB